MGHRDPLSIDGIEPDEFLSGSMAVCWHIRSWFKLIVRYPVITSLGFCFATSHPQLLGLTLCLHLFQALADALCINRAIIEIDFRGNWIGDEGMKVWWVECLAEVVWVWMDSGWDLWSITGTHGKSVTRFDRSFYCWSLNLFRIRLSDTFLQHMISTLFLNIEGWRGDSFVVRSILVGRSCRLDEIVF